MRRRTTYLATATAAVVAAAIAIPTIPGTATAAGRGTTASTAAASAGASSSIRWGGCDNPTLQQFGAQCGYLSVPLDWSRPDGRKIQIAVSRVRHKTPDRQYQGVMLVNPGGPGGSGLIYSIFQAFVPDGGGDSYDWIGFDPRGVGASRPSLSCDASYLDGPRPDYRMRPPGAEQAWLTRAKGYAADCERAGGELLDHLKTSDNARDMDAIRRALGQPKINYLGFSYGTYLGQVYASLFPERVRRFILDSNVDPRQIWYAANISQDYAFERVMQRFWAWVARYDSTYHLGTTAAAVERKYYESERRLLRNPRGQLGPSEWNDVFLNAGYVQFLWPDIAELFSAFYNDNDPKPAQAFYSSGDDNGYAMYLATECTDTAWPRDWSFWRKDNARVNREAPFVTYGNMWFNAPCAFWQAKSGIPVAVQDKGLPPILLAGETLDAATPIEGSREVRRRFHKSVLIATVGGVNHANTFAGNSCVDDVLVAYLKTGAVPERKRGDRYYDVICRPLPDPKPATAGSAATATAAAARNATGGAASGRLHPGAAAAARR